MSSFYKELSGKILKNNTYTDACNKLFEAYISKLAGTEYSVDKKTVKKLSTSIQYFYRSGSEKYLEEGASLLSMLLNVAGEQTHELIVIADNVFTQSGDFPNVDLLANKFPQIEFNVSFLSETLKDLRKELNTVEEIDHPLTDYQRSLWEELSLAKDIITSAPTSTGKTHIILQYLMHKLIEDEGAFAAVVVPTRALISELAGKIYEIAERKACADSIEICTVPKVGPFKEKTFFVMTQERLFEILQNGDLSFDYLFIDEAHNISDNTRGVLLHLTLQKMLEDSFPQIIISMPSPQYLNTFDSVFDDVVFTKKTTKHSPVAKIIMPVSLKGKQIRISRLGKEKVVLIDKGFTGAGQKLAKIVFRLGQGESNIVYRNQTNHCEDTARDIAARVSNNVVSPALEEAADYVENFLHQDFTLASSLRKGVAFHYSPLPGVVRSMIEGLARDGEVKFIVCTSTLAQGVNLPAKNLFLTNPTQQTPKYEKAARLEDVTLNNIVGRAGRMLSHFSGNVFLIDHDKWTFKDYFQESEEKENKIPTYFKVLNEDLPGVLKALDGSYDHQKSDQYSYYTIANKLLKEFGSGVLSSTVGAKDLALDGADRELLEVGVKKAYQELKVATFTLEANPTIGFIQQNKLYSLILGKRDLTAWILPHPKSGSIYDRLEKICQELHAAGIFLPQDDVSVRYACLIAVKWMTGDSLKSIIIEQINYDKNNGEKYNCNKSVRNVIKVINNNVRFRMSTALRCYHSIISTIIGERKLELQSRKIHSFIEVGGYENRFINLVNFGLSRDTALEIDDVLSKKIEINTIGDIKRLYHEKEFERLHSVTRREINSLLA